MTYRLTENGLIQRIADGAIIPADPANADYADFRAWQDAGNEPEASPARALGALQAAAGAAVDAEAERVRLCYVTGGSAKAMVYLRKVEEGRAWLAAGEPSDLAAWPLIAAEVGLTAESAGGVVAVWLAKNAMWTARAGEVERAVFAAKKAIEQAANETAVAAALIDGLAALAALRPA